MPLLSLKHDLADRIAYLDPHGGKSVQRMGSTGHARAAIIVVAFDVYDRIFILEAWADKCDTDVLTKRVFQTMRDYQPVRFGVEDYGQQTLYIDSLRREARRDGIWLPLEEHHPEHRVKKDYKIRTAIQPPLAQHRLFIEKRLHELRAEMAAFPQPSATRDLLDALAGAIVMHPARVTLTERREEVDEYRQYLLDQGLSEAYAEKRVQEEFGLSSKEE